MIDHLNLRYYSPTLASAHSSPESGRAKKRILLVEDEATLLQALRIMLESGGHQVITAGDGHEALALYQQMQAHIDLVVTDFALPKAGGTRFLSALRQLNPAVRILVISGYGLKPDERRFLEQHDIDFIQKPFGYEQLAQAVSGAR